MSLNHRGRFREAIQECRHLRLVVAKGWLYLQFPCIMLLELLGFVYFDEDNLLHAGSF